MNWNYSLIASRPYWWLLTVTSFVVGFLVAGNQLNLLFWLGLIYFTLPYNLLFHGISSLVSVDGQERLNFLKLIAVTNLVGLGFLFMLTTSAGQFWLLALAVNAVGFGWHRISFSSMPFLDSLSFSFYLTAPAVFGVLSGHWQPQYLPAILALGAWAVGVYIFSNIPKIDADRANGKTTISSWLGLPWATVASSGFFLLTALVVAMSYSGWIMVLAAFGMFFALNSSRFIGLKNAELFASGWRINLKLSYLAAMVATFLVLADFWG